MIPNLTKGAGIKGTALYVLHDERTLEDKALGAQLTPEHQSANRVGFTATRNLSTDDPELGWRLMCATAMNREQLKAATEVHKGGNRAKNLCGHLSLSWDHGDKVDRAEMERAADSVLKAMKWDHLQALIVEHTDHDHQHIHIVVNLVDPETGKIAPNRYNDAAKILQPWAHNYDSERGRAHVAPNRAAKMDALAEGRKGETPTRWLSREEWEAQRTAAREAGQQLWKEQKVERAAVLDATRKKARAIAAEVRGAFRTEWAELYREQRKAKAALDRATNPDKPDAAAVRHFINTHTELLTYGIRAQEQQGAARAGKDDLTEGSLRLIVQERWKDLTRPAELRQVVAAALVQDRAELKGKEDIAHHAAQRELWADHRARMDGLSERQKTERNQLVPRPQPANQNRQDRQAAPSPVQKQAAQPKPYIQSYRPTQVTVNRYEVLRQAEVKPPVPSRVINKPEIKEQVKPEPGNRPLPVKEALPAPNPEPSYNERVQAEAEAIRLRLEAAKQERQRQRFRDRGDRER